MLKLQSLDLSGCQISDRGWASVSMHGACLILGRVVRALFRLIFFQIVRRQSAARAAQSKMSETIARSASDVSQQKLNQEQHKHADASVLVARTNSAPLSVALPEQQLQTETAQSAHVGSLRSVMLSSCRLVTDVGVAALVGSFPGLHRF